jgi:hypothetical protein
MLPLVEGISSLSEVVVVGSAGKLRGVQVASASDDVP